MKRSWPIVLLALENAWREWWKTSITVVRLHARNWTSDIPSTKTCHPLEPDVRLREFIEQLSAAIFNGVSASVGRVRLQTFIHRHTHTHTHTHTRYHKLMQPHIQEAPLTTSEDSGLREIPRDIVPSNTKSDVTCIYATRTAGSAVDILHFHTLICTYLWINT